MSEKLDRIGAERDRAREKRDQWDARYKELCQKYIQQENTEIHELVRAQNMTPDQLAQVLAMLKNTPPGPGVAAPAPAADNHNTTGNEEDEQK